MPRWVSLLVLVSVALAGGVEVAWAAPAAAETHESTLPGEPVPSAEDAEEEKKADHLGALVAMLPVADRAFHYTSEVGPTLADAPPEPPPR